MQYNGHRTRQVDQRAWSRRNGLRRPRVVVGVSESQSSTAALAWAYDVCRRRGWYLDVVTAWPDTCDPPIHEVPGHYCDPRGRLVQALRTALESCRVELDGPAVQVFVENSDPVSALVQHSRGAELLVVGASDEGRSRVAGCAPVCDSCRQQLTCPVVVVDETGASSLRTA